MKRLLFCLILVCATSVVTASAAQRGHLCPVAGGSVGAAKSVTCKAAARTYLTFRHHCKPFHQQSCRIRVSGYRHAFVCRDRKNPIYCILVGSNSKVWVGFRIRKVQYISVIRVLN